MLLAFTQSEHLSEFAETSKELLPDLENIRILDDAEYENLIKHFLRYLDSDYVPAVVTGACYLKLIFENDGERFKNNIFKYIGEVYDIFDDYNGYNCVIAMLRLCGFDLFRQYLLRVLNAIEDNEAILKSVRNYLDNFDEIMTGNSSIEYYFGEFENFKIKITEENGRN